MTIVTQANQNANLFGEFLFGKQGKALERTDKAIYNGFKAKTGAAPDEEERMKLTIYRDRLKGITNVFINNGVLLNGDVDHPRVCRPVPRL